MRGPKDIYVHRHAGRAGSPEELATQLEDAFIVRDEGELAELFDEHAVLSPRGPSIDARGPAEIVTFAASQWAADRRYLAHVRRVVQAGDTAALVVDWSLTCHGSLDDRGERGRGVDILRRGADGAWRYLISLWHVCERSTGEQR
jgi:ketosteroid isomerase-like protein